MKLDLKTKEEYRRERVKLSRLSTSKLEKLLGELYQKRYIEQDINYESYYRLASSVYVRRTAGNESLLFHMKKFIM